MRKAAGYLAILMSFALILLATAGASTAWATPNAPGNNGTIKIHESPGEREPASP